MRTNAVYIQANFTGKLFICDIAFVGPKNTSTQTGISQTLAFEMRTIFRKLKLRVREHGGGSNLTPAQSSVLIRLERDGATTVSSLARAEGMRPQSMSAIVAPLQENGLVRSAPDLSDGRQTLVSLTPKCLKWLRDGRAARQDWLATTIAEKLSVREQEKLGEALELLARLVED